MNIVRVDGDHLTLEEVRAVAVDNIPVQISPEAVAKIQTSRQYVDRLVEEDAIVYGVTTGFGRFSNVKIDHEDVLALQRNIGNLAVQCRQ